MTTVARTYTEASSHWYTPEGQAFYEITKKDGSGMRAPTIADARKLGLLPSVTKIIGILDKPELNNWKLEQGILAVLSTPKKEGESLDAFVHRVLHEEKVHEEEAKRAREVGSQVHEAIDNALSGREWDHGLSHYVEPVIEWVENTGGKIIWTEKILVASNYAGKADLFLNLPKLKTRYLTDFKTCSRLPDKDSYIEHRLQTAAYAATIPDHESILTANIYICTKGKPEIKVFVQDDWKYTHVYGFLPLLQYWQFANKYSPPIVPKS